MKKRLFYDESIKKRIRYKNFLERIFSLKRMKKTNKSITIMNILTIFGFKFIWADISNFKKIKNNYKKVLKRLKNKSKIKVLFLVNDLAKWKTNSLYKLMENTDLYEPFIALTAPDKYESYTQDERAEILHTSYEYFTSRGMECVYAYDFETGEPVSLEEFNPDVVFYPQPWGLSEIVLPDVVSEYALTCYVPYFVPNYGILHMDCMLFHASLFRYYVLNKYWEKLYKKYMKPVNNNIFGLGHTIIDEINEYKKNNLEKNDYVIYAPHWSIKNNIYKSPENYSTFNITGIYILNFAKNHPEFNWVFKPHPILKIMLKRLGWTEEMVDAYYSEWESFATCCYDSSYIDLFMKSKALITDCGSFLVEYFFTGKPIIHLISKDCKVRPKKPSAKIFNTFYKTTKKQDFLKWMYDVVMRENDIWKADREAVMKEMLPKGDAATNIMNNLTKAIKGKI